MPFKFSLLAATTLALAAASSTVTAKPFKWAGSSDIQTMDIHSQNSALGNGIHAAVYESLVMFNSRTLKVEPVLATSWQQVSPTQMRFKLRQGVKFSDGSTMTADDVVYSLQRAADKSRSAFAADMAPIASATAADTYTLKIALKAPIPSLLGLLSNYHGGIMVCKKAAEQLGEAFVTKPTGTGPFVFVEYHPQQFVKLAANKAYFRGAPQIDEITYRYIPSDATRDLALRSGELDMVFGRQVDEWAQSLKRIIEGKKP